MTLLTTIICLWFVGQVIGRCVPMPRVETRAEMIRRLTGRVGR